MQDQKFKNTSRLVLICNVTIQLVFKSIYSINQLGLVDGNL